jgi:hypothetical protein
MNFPVAGSKMATALGFIVKATGDNLKMNTKYVIADTKY